MADTELHGQPDIVVVQVHLTICVCPAFLLSATFDDKPRVTNTDKVTYHY